MNRRVVVTGMGGVTALGDAWEGLLVEIMDVLSPSILQRLKLQEGLFRAALNPAQLSQPIWTLSTTVNGSGATLKGWEAERRSYEVPPAKKAA